MKQNTARLGLLSLALGLTACTTTFQETKIDYKSAGKNQAPSLEVPPNLTQLSQDSRYIVRGGVVSAAAMQAYAKAGKPTDAAGAAKALKAGLPVKTAIGTLSYDKTGDLATPSFSMFKWENGKIVAAE